ncbi:O-acyltransferase like protein-like [Uranotaenia lowii]|uniref:O-acyltransferase like protein-like n=1 Tax=Uranotaenia lowii TaxID=190385 RepID=UPI0024798576|nr:O-acyltransferase like protein-like [Uranotaenia lowii]
MYLASYVLILFTFTVVQLQTVSALEISHSVIIHKLEKLPFSLANWLGDYRFRNGEIPKENICLQQLETFKKRLNENVFWALRVYDQWGKIPPNVLHGEFFAPGIFDECIRLSVGLDDGFFEGLHCMIPFYLKVAPIPVISIRLGICVPKSCDTELLNQLLREFTFEKGFSLQEDGMYCDSRQPNDLNNGTTISAIVIFSLIGLTAVVCTAFHVIMILLNGNPPMFVHKVSLYTNIISLLKTVPKATEKSDTIDAVYGLRSVIMLQLIIHYIHESLLIIPVANPESRQEYFESVLGIFNHRLSALAFDVFLGLSAIALTYKVLLQLHQTQSLNLLSIWIDRILRILPAYGLLIYFWVAFGRFFGQGPLYREFVLPEIDACETNWWSAILFVQNYVNPENMCLPHTWYLSVDMQLYLITPLLVWALWKFGKKVLWLIAALAIGSVVYVLLMFILNDFSLNSENLQMTRHTYYATHARAAVWLCGIAFGYFLFSTRTYQVKWPVWVLVLGSIIATAISAFVMFATYEIFRPRLTMDPVLDGFYEAFHRVAFVLGLMWLIFMCANGYGSLLNDILSWSFWQPVARLSYAMYLLHYPILLVTFTGALRQPFHFGEISLQYVSVGVIAITAAGSVVWTLFIERHFLAIKSSTRAAWFGEQMQIKRAFS